MHASKTKCGGIILTICINKIIFVTFTYICKINAMNIKIQTISRHYWYYTYNNSDYY